ncbi:MBL fold metallo-hydrolase [Streptomyces sp. PmtG]
MNAIEIIGLRPRLHLFRFAIGQAYLWRDEDGLTLIDAGAPGSGPGLVDAITGLGLRPGDLRRVVLTRFHGDHAGGAGEVAALTRATVLAHHLDAPMVRGEVPGTGPVLDDWEEPLFATVSKDLPKPTEQRVYAAEAQEVADGDVLPFGGGARIVGAPGHTSGSIGVHLPEHGVLFTGDAIRAGLIPCRPRDRGPRFRSPPLGKPGSPPPKRDSCRAERAGRRGATGATSGGPSLRRSVLPGAPRRGRPARGNRNAQNSLHL